MSKNISNFFKKLYTMGHMNENQPLSLMRPIENDQHLLTQIKIVKKQWLTWGYRKICSHLNKAWAEYAQVRQVQASRVNPKRVYKIMKRNGLLKNQDGHKALIKECQDAKGFPKYKREELFNKLKRLIENKKFSIERIAEQLEVNRRTVSRWLRPGAKNTIRLKNLKELNAFLYGRRVD